MAVFIASCPNTEKDDRILALKTIVRPWVWINNKPQNQTLQFQTAFANAHNTRHAFTYNTGRAALYSILKAIRTSSQDEVITQSYTCMAVSTAIIWTGAKPVYADINPKTFNTDVTYLKKLVSSKTKAIILQHTFGLPANIEKIKAFITHKNSKRSHKDKIYLIEDCAHSLGIKHKGKKVGEWGDAAFFSFGQEKIISCTQGGAALTKDPEIQNRIQNDYATLKFPNFFTIFRLLVHPLLWQIINQSYYFPCKVSLGKLLILCFRAVCLLKKHADPNTVDFASPDIRKMANAQAIILSNQYGKLARFNRHRQQIATIYNKILPHKHKIQYPNHSFLRFQILTPKKEHLIQELKQERIIPGNWYVSPIHPVTQDLAKFGYRIGSCKNAEEATKQNVNLPTHIGVTNQDAIQIARIVKSCTSLC